MLKINYYIQNIVLIVAMTILISSVFNFEILFLILYLQMIVGFVRYISSGILLLVKVRIENLSYIHWIGATLYLFSLWILKEVGVASAQLYHYYLFIVPWCFALLYWYISFRLYQIDKHKKSRGFLSRISYYYDH